MYLTSFVGLVLVSLQFPWVSFRMNEYDLQPWIMMAFLSILIVAVVEGRYKYIWYVFGLLVVAFTLVLVNKEFNFDVLRRLVSVLALMSSYFLFSYYLNTRGLDNALKLLLLGNLIYLVAGLCQYLFGKDLLSFLLAFRGNDQRGVASLTPEPTFFGLLLVLYSTIFVSYSKLNIKILCLLALNIAFILFISKSTTALMSLVLVFAILAIASRAPLYQKVVVALVGGSITVLLIVYISSSEFGRISILIGLLLESPMELFESDQSAKIRLGHVLSPYLMAYENWLLPVPEGDIGELRLQVMHHYFSESFLFHITNNKTSSFIGSYLLAGGLFFVMLKIWIGLKAFKNKSFGAYVAITSILVLSLPPGLPLVGMSVAVINDIRRS